MVFSGALGCAMFFKGLIKSIFKYFIPALLCFSCSGISLNKGECREFELTEFKTLKVDTLKITCVNFKEIFVNRYDPDLKRDIHSSYPVFDLKIKVDDDEKTFPEIKYGEVATYYAYRIKATWIVVGTSDFPSHARLKISK